jgi:hypothetical protein
MPVGIFTANTIDYTGHLKAAVLISPQMDKDGHG